MLKKETGFTLIELLVSISIIAILTALLSVNFIGARQRGRDGQRKANLYQLQAALELYRSTNGLYPFPSMAPSPGCGNNISLSDSNAVYMKSVPCDPSSSSSTPVPYTYNSADGLNYTVFACLENDSDNARDATKNPACSAASFTLENQ